MRVVYLLVGLLLNAAAFAQPAIDGDKPVFMDADRLGYDQKNSLVVALGNVRVFQGDSILYADRITYFQNQNTVRADGNVRVEDKAKNETYYAEEVLLRDDLKQGVIQNFSVRMQDNSQFAAREAQRVSETKTKLKKAVYSPCEICEGKSPFWQIKADKVEIDEEDNAAYYDDLFLEFYGVPVAYTPYFSHPLPGTEARSGFLRPEYGQNSNLGSTFRAPYYIAIAPDKDATITPFLTSEDGLVMIGEYRQRTDNGFFTFEGSITNPNKRDDNGLELNEREIRGHIFAKGDSRFNEHWGWGFDIQRTTDDTYLRRYGFNNLESLQSRLYTEGLYGRSFVQIEGLTFQGLEEQDDPDLEPFVIPLIRAYRESDPGLFGVAGLRHFNSANVQVLTRDVGAKSQRLSINNGLKLPFKTSSGHLFDASVSARTDLYSVDDLTLSDGSEFNDQEMRMRPQASLKWRYPLIKSMENSSLTIEPTVLAIAQPNGGNPEEIPSEDSNVVEFSDTNLFSLDPFPGLDRVDEGSRVAYGLRAQWLFNRSYLNFLFGQSYSFQDETPFPYNDEIGEPFSDYVGHVSFDYDPFRIAYRFRLDQDDLSPNSQTLSTGFNYRPVRLNIDYVNIEDDAFLEDREEILLAGGLQLTDEWSLNGHARRDLLLNDMLSAGGGLMYQNDCFTLFTQFNRVFTRDRDVEPDDSVTVRVSFKNLVEFGS